MTFMYRLTLDCAHLALCETATPGHHPLVSERFVCKVCPKDAQPGTRGWAKGHPLRLVVKVEKVHPEDLPI